MRTGAKMIWPNWAHLRMGPLLKGGVPFRKFRAKVLLHGNFCPLEHIYVYGFDKFRVLARATKVSEENQELVRQDGETVIVFSGDSRHFRDLPEASATLRFALECIAAPRSKALSHSNLPPIALNIRRGKDFREAEKPADFETGGGLRTPLQWFVNSLVRVRAMIGHDIGAYVISDGDYDDLKPVLCMRNVELIETQSAIDDLLLLSRARFLLASGGSSFSAWGSFLSKAPTLAIPGQSMSWFGLDGTQGLTFDPERSPDLPPTILRRIEEGHVRTPSRSELQPHNVRQLNGASGANGARRTK